MGASYSLRWAWRVFEDYRELHTRALDITLARFGILPAQMVWCLAKDPKRWINFKKFVAVIERSLVNEVPGQDVPWNLIEEWAGRHGILHSTKNYQVVDM